MTGDDAGSTPEDLKIGREIARLRELPFVAMKGNEVKSLWAPVEVHEASDAREYHAECLLGSAYALELLHYLRWLESEDIETSGAIGNVVEAMVKRGKWGGAEIGFFHALEQHLACGHVQMGDGFTARADDPPKGELTS